ncbi:bacteriocin resistance YdeI/OmpD-like protein [Natranaerovirga pectinivora]|uniref:Bacteriocin resistance YdeI/OmpD-like protein n=1 Tax=Natranaerovirga pectinivora TaxID=682400 RepID=A0A4R3MNV2_9FIRM|nr:YdeI/OmpD-associated family protein [Natranaerovirga pectinivora]TCT16220.1 bacteriocin resistance YdeI/OmpD-like protein [Natranaerovirga pectinivora]
MTLLEFETKLLQIKDWTIIRLPINISKELPSRGMVMIEGTINTTKIKIPLEPDGMGSHWFRVDNSLCEELALKVGDIISLSIISTNTLIEPEVPDDLNKFLSLFNLESQWNTITTKARWEWIRWIRATHNPQTREKRIQTACSMLDSGKKRPCCFDQSRCTEPYVSKNGILIINL